jgi:phage protein U
MLMMIGPVRFKVAPFNATAATFTHGADFAEKPVMGVRPPLEFVGDSGQSWTINAHLFPERFGGESNLLALRVIRASGIPQYMIRGDGLVMGWVALMQVAERSSYFDRRGRGRVIDVDITLRRAKAPHPAGFFAALAPIFGGVIG